MSEIDVNTKELQNNEVTTNKSFEQIQENEELIKQPHDTSCESKSYDILKSTLHIDTAKDDYKQLFLNAPAGYVIYTSDFQILDANQIFCARAGIEHEKIHEHTIIEFISPLNHKEFVFMKEKLEKGLDREVILAQFVGNNQIIDVSIASKCMFSTKDVEDKSTAIDSIYCSFIMDISDLIHQRNEILRMSYHDAMTGLFNRRYYFHIIKQLDKEAHLPLSLATIDLDGLKIINDTLGHEFGDEAIITVCNILKKNADANFTLIRTGGDEIIILACKTSSTKLLDFMKHCEYEISDCCVQGIPLSISYGVATRNDLHESIETISALSEDLMYSNKILRSPKRKTMIVDTMAKRLFERQKDIKEHCEEVSRIAVRFGKYINLPEKKVEMLKQLGYIHDIGLIAIDNVPLLFEREFSEKVHTDLMRHPQIGNRIVRSLFGFEEVATAVLYHHENWDGSGYPYALVGERIPYLARVIRIIDDYDWHKRVMESRNMQVTLKDMQRKIMNESTVKYDPVLATMFLSFMKHLF